ncbi:uncharacterized protein METZ01_LOCUS447261, partial [marine metagenome]
MTLRQVFLATVLQPSLARRLRVRRTRSAESGSPGRTRTSDMVVNSH